MSSTGFSNHTIVITGASSGIGKALALRLADEGANLALASRSQERLEEVAAECQRRGVAALVVPTDVSDEAQCQELMTQAYSQFGQIDVLINNAGVGAFSKLEDMPNLQLLKQVMEVNFYGLVYCTYYALPYLKATRGRLVNISSLGGKFAVPYNTPYCSSKFALMGFSDALRMELSDSGVSVTVVCPYWVITEFHENERDSQGRRHGPGGRDIYTRNMMTADTCARIIIHAAKRRKREVVMGPGWLASWLKLIAPGLLDKLTVTNFVRPALERMSEARTSTR